MAYIRWSKVLEVLFVPSPEIFTQWDAGHAVHFSSWIKPGRSQENPKETAGYFRTWVWMWLVNSVHGHMSCFKGLCTLAQVVVITFSWEFCFVFHLNLVDC